MLSEQIGKFAGTQAEVAVVTMEDVAEDKMAPPSPVHCSMIISEAHAHYMDTVREKRGAAVP